MKTILFSICLAFVFALVILEFAKDCSGATTPREKLKPIESWVGICLDDNKDSAYPKTGMVVDDRQWQNLWSVWHPDAALPSVDFSKELVLVAKVRGPNRMRVGRLVIDSGDVTFQPIATKKGGPGFGHILVKVPRNGLKSVNGELVPASTPVKGFIDVTMVGKVRTGVMAIGGETTGNTMTCDNVTWELRLDQDQLVTAQKLGVQYARVTGRLEVKQGVEVPTRWIVNVSSIGVVGDEAPDPKGMPKKGGEAFVSITTVQSGGIAGIMNSTTIQANGRLSKLVSLGGQRPTNQMDASRLAELHELIRETDWSKVPTRTRNRNAADSFQFDITIVTQRGSRTYSIDQTSLPTVVPLEQLINLFQ